MTTEQYVIVALWALGSIMYVLDLNWRAKSGDFVMAAVWPLAVMGVLVYSVLILIGRALSRLDYRKG